MNNKPIHLDFNDVISMDQGNEFGRLGQTFKVSQLTSIIGEASKDRITNTGAVDLFNDKGLKCEALVLNGGEWKRGTIKFCLKFYPDEPDNLTGSTQELETQLESPLDEIRKLMDNNI